MKLNIDLLRRYYPRSFLRLLLLSFAAVALPLVLAFVNAALLVERLSDQSQTAVGQAAQAARASRLLMEEVTALERAVRQFLVLGDAALIGDYERVRGRFKNTTSELALLPLDELQLRELNRTVDREEELFALLRAAPPRAADKLALIQGYLALSDLARGMLDISNDLIDREVERLRQTAARAQEMLWWHLAATIPLGLAICLAVTFFIARPVRQLDQAIRRLGRGKFVEGIRIDGPADLQFLGGRLEWLRRRLLELEQQKQLFLRHVSHELKTPLTSLREGSELLADGTAGSLTPVQGEIVGILRQKSAQLQQLIDDLLDYHRAQEVVARLELAPVRIDQVVLRVLDEHRLAAAAHGVRFEARTPPATIVADQDKLRVAIDNLVSNAVKYSPDGGKVVVELREQRDTLALEVSDAGPGIPAEDRERIFDWFFRCEDGHHSRVRGSGVGLAIAREFVLAHRGRLEVVDDGARGGHFRMSLPLSDSGNLS